MGFFSSKMSTAPSVARASSGGVRKNALDAPMVDLPPASFPEGDLGHLGYELFRVCGLSVFTLSTLPVGEHFAEVVKAAPVFGASESNMIGTGRFTDREVAGMWAAWDSPNGSLITAHCFADEDGSHRSSDFIFMNVMERIPLTGPQVEWGIATVGKVPAPVAAILETGTPVPVWELPGLDSLRPAMTASAAVPQLLAQRLRDAGWIEVSENLYKAIVSTPHERSQVVMFGSWGPSHFACMSAVAHAENGRIPEILRGVAFGEYKLDVVEDLVFLIKTLPAGPPSPTAEEINDTAIALGRFADRVEADLSASDDF